MESTGIVDSMNLNKAKAYWTKQALMQALLVVEFRMFPKRVGITINLQLLFLLVASFLRPSTHHMNRQGITNLGSWYCISFLVPHSAGPLNMETIVRTMGSSTRPNEMTLRSCTAISTYSYRSILVVATNTSGAHLETPTFGSGVWLRWLGA